jgi:hypothetical protein
MANQHMSDLTEQRKIAERVLASGAATVAELANYWGLPRQTVQRWANGLDVAALRRSAVTAAIWQATRREAPAPTRDGKTLTEA